MTLVYDLPEIGDMDEGIVERSENSGDTEDEFTCNDQILVDNSHAFYSFRRSNKITCLRELEGLEKYSRWRRALPSFWEA